jgi:hypothetical protein
LALYIIPPLTSTLGRGDLLVSRPVCFTPRERASSVLCLRKWMGPKDSLEYNSTFGLETISGRYWIGVKVDRVPI